jgi:predicted Zn-dependent peptidase
VSRGRTSSWAAVVAALFVCAAGPARAQDTPPANGTLPSGVVYEIRPNAAQSAAAVALWYRAPAGGFDGAAVPGLSRLAAATVAASKPITGTSLAGLVDRWGGRLSVAAYADSVAVTVLVAPDHVARAVRAMTTDYFAPVVTAEGLRAAQSDSTEDAIYRSIAPDAIEDALGAALFATGPLHDGTIGSADSLAGVKLDRVRAFADRAFRPGNAILVLTGNVDAGALANVAARAGAAPAAALPEAVAAQAARPARAPPLRREGEFAGTGLGWIGPPIADEAAATALDFIADALFAPRKGTVAKALGSRKAVVTGKFVTYRNPGVFLVTISGDDAEAARPLVEKAVADAAKPMAPAAFAVARAAFVYRLLGEMETPTEISDTFGWYAVEGGPAYAPAEGGLRGRYFTLASQLTPASVAQAVATYLGPAPAVVTQVKRSATRPRTPA